MTWGERPSEVERRWSFLLEAWSSSIETPLGSSVSNGCVVARCQLALKHLGPDELVSLANVPHGLQVLHRKQLGRNRTLPQSPRCAEVVDVA